MFQADDDNETENDEDEVIFTDLHAVLRDDIESSERHVLPPHHRCAYQRFLETTPAVLQSLL